MAPLALEQGDLAGRLGAQTVRYQGNWFPHRLRTPVEGAVLFAGSLIANVVGNALLAEYLVSPVVRLFFLAVAIRLIAFRRAAPFDKFQQVPLPVRQGDEAGIVHDGPDEVRPQSTGS